MSFPRDTVTQMLDRLGAHPFYRNRLPGAVSGAEEFAAAIPLMARGV